MKVLCKDFKIVSVYIGSRLQNRPQWGYKIAYNERTAKGTYYRKADARKAISDYVKKMKSPAFTGDFLASMAARACTERDEKGKRVIDGWAIKEMPLTVFQAITRKARGFLLRAE
ncbi:MAG: hypothetical protein HFF84_01730 [Oscillibacter sp.]|nr:hypothetical protein [Oscillibacter sp.]